MNQNFAFHENYRDDEPIEAGSDRSFGCTLGTILVVIGAAKILLAGSLSAIPCFISAAGIVLLLLGIFSPSRLWKVNRVWLKVGAVIAKVINPIVLALMFFAVVTPMALLMRIAGKRPLRLVPNRAASSYWISREPTVDVASSMMRQF